MIHKVHNGTEKAEQGVYTDQQIRIHIIQSLRLYYSRVDTCEQQPISLRVMQGSCSISSLNIRGGACVACSCMGSMSDAS